MRGVFAPYQRGLVREQGMQGKSDSLPPTFVNVFIPILSFLTSTTVFNTTIMIYGTV